MVRAKLAMMQKIKTANFRNLCPHFETSAGEPLDSGPADEEIPGVVKNAGIGVCYVPLRQ
jgi:hypothetical protein